MDNMCSCRCRCVTVALIVSAIVGVIAAFLQISGVITVTPAFLWTLFGIAVGFLAVYILSPARCCGLEPRTCGCSALNASLLGSLGTALFSAVLLAVGIVATSVLSAVLIGILIGFFSLLLTSAVCFIRSVYCR